MKTPLIALGMVAATVGIWQWRSRDAPAPAAVDSSQLALDRLWLDKLPTTEREVFNLFVALDDDGLGIHQATSVWTGRYELFKFVAKDNTLRVVYPQTGERETVTLRARTCNQGEFDYCLEVVGSTRGVQRYYSKREWVIDRAASGAQLASKVDALLHAPTAR